MIHFLRFEWSLSETQRVNSPLSLVTFCTLIADSSSVKSERTRSLRFYSRRFLATLPCEIASNERSGSACSDWQSVGSTGVKIVARDPRVFAHRGNQGPVPPALFSPSYLYCVYYSPLCMTTIRDRAKEAAREIAWVIHARAVPSGVEQNTFV